MCPFCLTTAALVAAGALSAGSAGAIAAKLFHSRKLSALNASPSLNKKEKHS
jgi:hypothetical protein